MYRNTSSKLELKSNSSSVHRLLWEKGVKWGPCPGKRCHGCVPPGAKHHVCGTVLQGRNMQLIPKEERALSDGDTVMRSAFDA